MEAGSKGSELGLLVVGVGWLGSRRASAARWARGVRLVAVHDASESLARRVGAARKVPVAPNLTAALRMPEVDAVVVATPHADHSRTVRRALEAGKHVLCEKPLAIDPDDAAALAGMAETRGLRLATGFNHRLYPPIAEALAMVEAGAIGRVRSIRVEIGHRASADFLASWHVEPSVSGGGTLMDNGPHACDLIRRFAGEIHAAKGYVTDTLGLPDGCESEAFALFRGPGCRVAELRSSWTQPTGYLTVEVRGHSGHLRVETAPWRLTGRLEGGRTIHRSYLKERIYALIHQRLRGCEPSLVAELEAFGAATRGEAMADLVADGRDGARASEMVHAAYRASESGEEVLIEPTTWPATHSRWPMELGEVA